MKNNIKKTFLVLCFFLNTIFGLTKDAGYMILCKEFIEFANLDLSEATKKEKFINSAQEKIVALGQKYESAKNLNKINLSEWYEYIKSEFNAINGNRIFDSACALLADEFITPHGQCHLRYQLLNMDPENVFADKEHVRGMNDLLNLLSSSEVDPRLMPAIEGLLKKIKKIDLNIEFLRNYCDKALVNNYISEKKSWKDKIIGKYKDIFSYFSLSFCASFGYKYYEYKRQNWKNQLECEEKYLAAKEYQKFIQENSKKTKIDFTKHIRGLSRSFNGLIRFGCEGYYFDNNEKDKHLDCVENVKKINNILADEFVARYEMVYKDGKFHIPGFLLNTTLDHIKYFTGINFYKAIRNDQYNIFNGCPDGFVKENFGLKTFILSVSIGVPLASVWFVLRPFWIKRYQVYFLGKLYALEAEKLELTKELYQIVDYLYQQSKNKISHKFKEFKMIESILRDPQALAELNEIRSMGSGIMSYIRRFGSMQAMPGIYVHYYQNNVRNNKLLEIMNHFIGSIDILVASVKLLKKPIDNTKNVCIPKINFDSVEVFLNVEKVYIPAIKKSVPNSIQFDKKNRIAVLVSPIAAGKTVFLSSLLSVFYFQRIGIVPALSATYSYFDVVRQKIRESYTLGNGESKGSSELKEMHNMKQAILKETVPTLCIVDELYSGMNPEDALYYGVKDMDFFSRQSHVLLLVTTHLPGLAKYIITRVQENSGIKYYYFNIETEPNGSWFKPMYKLIQDINGEDPNNWYLKNDILRRAYIEAKEVGSV